MVVSRRCAPVLFALLFGLLVLPLSAEPLYYWRALPVSQPATAQLLTLFCQACGTGNETGRDIPLVSVLRDTLGRQTEASNRITAVWLLSYSHPTIAQRSLAAIPFFYWTLSDGSAKVKQKDTAPLLDLSAPEHPATTNVVRQILQWTAFDTVGTPVRASSRAYRTNEIDHERLHLEEANSYLLHAPVGNSSNQLTSEERDTVMARLELRKKLLGGFVNSARVSSLGREAGFEQERIRSRNWELLRQCAEKTGLVFEPVTLAGSDQKYGMLWYPARGVLEPGGSDLKPIWKLLGIKDPYTDDRLTKWSGLTKTETGVTLIPLSLYSLTYPRQPLLLADFRDTRHLRRRDITQKSIDEVTGGVIGLSHFANWYYFVASDIFNFLQERRGKANNRAERLDSFSEFRVSLALDHDLDPALKQELERHADFLSSNPLESTPANEMKAAIDRYTWLTVEAAGDNSRLMRRIDNQRREELAAFSATPRRQGIDVALYAVTLGKYTHRAKSDSENLESLDTYRRVESALGFLDKLVAAGTPPEVAYQEARIRAAVVELGNLMPSIPSPQIHLRAQQTLEALAKILSSKELRADCERTSQELMHDGRLPSTSVPGIVAEPVLTPHREDLK